MKSEAKATDKQKKRGNQRNLIVRSGEEARELGRKGGIASGAARRARCSFAESLRQALTVPIPITSDRHRDWADMIERFGMCDLTAQNLIICRMIQSAIAGDVRAATFVRDTLMLTSGGIEDAGNASRTAPVTADGLDRLTRYHLLEVAEVRAKVGRVIADAEEMDGICHGRTAEAERRNAADTARTYQEAGLVTLDEDANGVCVDLKGIERMERETAREAEEGGGDD